MQAKSLFPSFLTAFFLFFTGLPFNFAVDERLPKVPEVEVIEDKVSKSLFIVSRNSDFSSQDVNFSPNEKVFVKVSQNSDIPANATLTLLDQDKKTLFTLSMTQDKNEFKASFEAPNNQGVYYVHIEIRGEGLSFSGEKNINVQGDSSDNSNTQNVKSEASSFVSTSEKDLGQSANTVVPEFAENPEPPEKNIFLSFFERFFAWIRNLFSIGS